MSGPGSLKDVTLRPWPAQQKEELSKDELYRQIFQLTEERGHLRGITEKTLQEEIDAGKDVPEDVMQGVEREQENEEEPSAKEKLEEVQRTRMDMIGHLDWAIFAATNALDLVSLILSQDPNKRADSSFSYQFRQQGVPLGSFGVTEEHHEHRTKKEVEIQRDLDTARRQQLVMKGSRMEGLDTATDDILKAATQLEKEVRKETKYWEEVLSISRKGWSIQRTRQGARQAPFAVRYGLPEASDHFKARGSAPLRMDQDGSIILDPTLTLKPKTLRVRICDNGNISGASYLPSEATITELAIEKSVQLARDSLFEEELYHEMSLESRQLLAYGVELRDSVIHVSAPGLGIRSAQRKFLIDCIPRDDNVVTSQDHSQDWLAQNIAEVLRLVLAHEHSMRLYRRSQLPPPMTAQKRQKPTPPLLRTLLALFRHIDGADSLHAYLEDVAKTLQSAGIPVSLSTTRETSWTALSETLAKSKTQDPSPVSQLLQVFQRPFDGLATLTLPSFSSSSSSSSSNDTPTTPSSSQSQSSTLTIATRTVIGPPTFGTEHKLTLPPILSTTQDPTNQAQARDFKFSSTAEVTSYLDEILSLDIAHAFLLREFNGRATIKSRGEPRISVGRLPGKKDKGMGKGSRDVLVEVKDAKLVVSVMDLKAAEEEAETTCTWDGKIKAEGPLRDMVKKWVG